MDKETKFQMTWEESKEYLNPRIKKATEAYANVKDIGKYIQWLRGYDVEESEVFHDPSKFF